jgi:hypothetical protein
MYALFWLEYLKGKYHSEDLSIDGKIILKWVLKKYGCKVWTGFIWLKILTSGKM